MDEKLEFVTLALSGGIAVSELCHRFGVSRETGYQVLSRYRLEGLDGLTPHSRRPHTSPGQTEASIDEAVVGLRKEHPTWGGRKLRRRLQDLGMTRVPSASTVTAILRRHGLLDQAESERHRPFRRFEHSEPNDLWQMDFKGHFPTERGRCHPLTVLDDHSRYSLAIEACRDERDRTVRPRLAALFRRYGMPAAILADNGPPWGAPGFYEPGYTALGVWLMLLGIELWHGRPRHPQTQGKEERFHRTLLSDVIQHRHFRDLDECQTAFDAWRPVYNNERPHQAIDMEVPASRYAPSPRNFPEKITQPEYNQLPISKVSRDGYIQFNKQKFKISMAFAGHNVAFRPTRQDGLYDVLFSRFTVAQVNLRDGEA